MGNLKQTPAINQPLKFVSPRKSASKDRQATPNPPKTATQTRANVHASLTVDRVFSKHRINCYLADFGVWRCCGALFALQFGHIRPENIYSSQE